MEAAGQRPYTKEDGEKLASELGAMGYFECSALLQQNIAETFEGVIRTLKGGAPAMGAQGATAGGQASSADANGGNSQGTQNSADGNSADGNGKFGKKKIKCSIL